MPPTLFGHRVQRPPLSTADSLRRFNRQSCALALLWFVLILVAFIGIIFLFFWWAYSVEMSGG